VPDRAALGIPSHFAAARGAYVIRPYRADRPRQGVVIVQGTSTTRGLVEALPELDRRGLNLKIVAAVSPQLFAAQEPVYRESVLADDERWDAMCVTNRALRLMGDWIANELVAAYSLSSDWDDRWRTGGTVDEVLEEARLTPEWLLAGLERFARERPARRDRMRAILARLDGDGET
jgi:transketolase